MEATHNLFSGHLKQVVYQGETMLVQIALAEGGLVSMRRSTRREIVERLPQPGAEITVALHPDDTIVVPGRKVAQ